MDQTFTSTPETQPLHENPLYIEGKAQIAAGEWQKALENFQLLQTTYPNDPEVKDLLEEVQVRATLSSYQRTPPRRRVKKHLSSRQVVVGVLVASVILIITYITYEMWLKPLVKQEFRLRQITQLRSKADEAIAAGDYEEALQYLQQLQTILPEDPETRAALHQIELVEKSSTLYNKAKTHIAAEEWDEAVDALIELQKLDPHYRDLPRLLQVTQKAQTMEEQYQAAEAAFSYNDWPTAISRYEALQQADFTFRFEEIQARLFDSHLRYGQTLLDTPKITSNQLNEALGHFSEALKLRPLDSKALNERHLAETYLLALNTADQDEAIDLLQTIYSTQPDYAGGSVAQLLYTSLLERASASMLTGDKAAAKTDYQLAAQLLVDDPSEAQRMLLELAAEPISK
jgi:Flp pilus assembly protein TadD